jgi:glutamate-1-semialdehyde 2,1-aminomutase
MITQKSEMFLKKMKRLVPGGASSNARCGNTIAVSKGYGAEIVDLDGNHYIDYILGFGPILLGHGNQQVAETVYHAIKNGTTFAFSHELEYKVAEKIISLYPSIEMIRFCNSGTDAATTAYRIAKTKTGRSGIIKIEGDYNGGFDMLMYDIPGVEVINLDKGPTAGSNGLLNCDNNLVMTVPFNDSDILAETLKKHHKDIAAMFMEPILGNTAAIMPLPGYLEKVRLLCDEFEVILVFDEIKTGFRVAKGGAQEYFSVKSDLTLLGKAIANGLPLAAIGGKRSLMELVAPGVVHHCGTYFGNLPCIAAADAVLSELHKADYNSLMKRGKRLAEGICELLRQAGVIAHWHGVGSMFGITIGPESPNDYRNWWLKTNRAFWIKVGQCLREHGILTDGFIGLFFLSFAHSDRHIEKTLNACQIAIKQAKESE